MAVDSGTRTICDLFDRPLTLTTTPEAGNGGFGWTIADTSSAGAPTYIGTLEDGGSMKLTLAADNEVENVCMFANDLLMFDLRKIQHYFMTLRVAAVSNTSVLTWGLGAARADDEDTVVTNAFFKMEGATSTTAVVCESDDATTDNDDKATGVTQAAVYKKYHIDFTNGIADVRFFINGARVASGTTFDMSSLTAGLNVQPMFQISKTASTSVPAIQIAKVKIQYTYAYGE